METCDADVPHVMTPRETAPAPQAEDDAIPCIPHALEAPQVLPEMPLVEPGEVDAHELVRSRQDYESDLVGPTREDSPWQARDGTDVEASPGAIDWQKEWATCPAGQTRSRWSLAEDRRGNPVLHIQWAVQDSRPCPHGTPPSTSPRRVLTGRPERASQAWQRARQRPATPEVKTADPKRAGIEGTLWQGLRAFG